MRQWYIGCSGFLYRHWRARFYPEKLAQKKWLEFYCEHFNTVELNVTFYRVPKPDVFSGWYQRTPQNFLFTVKAPRLITHFKKFKNITTEISSFYDIVSDGLKEKLGPVLFQLHPKYVYTEENLDRLLRHLSPLFNNVIEFRHESWWNPVVLKQLKAAGIAFCGISYPKLPEEVIKTSQTIYYRFHGIPDLYRSPYSEHALASVVSQIKLQRGVRDVFIYFNNDIDVHAIHNAKTVQVLTSIKQAVLQREKVR